MTRSRTSPPVEQHDLRLPWRFALGSTWATARRALRDWLQTPDAGAGAATIDLTAQERRQAVREAEYQAKLDAESRVLRVTGRGRLGQRLTAIRRLLTTIDWPCAYCRTVNHTSEVIWDQARFGLICTQCHQIQTYQDHIRWWDPRAGRGRRG